MINHNANISIQERTEEFAIRVINAYSELNKRHFDERPRRGFLAQETRELMMQAKSYQNNF